MSSVVTRGQDAAAGCTEHRRRVGRSGQSWAVAGRWARPRVVDLGNELGRAHVGRRDPRR